MLIEIIIVSIISIIILIIRKVKLNLSQIKIKVKGYQILIIMAVIEITAVFLFKAFPDSKIFKILSLSYIIYPAIMIVTLINFKNYFMKLFFLGTLLNFIAVAFNDFKMPVYILENIANSQATIILLESGQDLIHSLMTDSTRFKILCDIITLSPPYPFVKTISIGDILLLLGVFVFWQELFY
ncbi:MAG: DUF5317 domain-containing protein [Tissierellia bacterium]|nr:DUF5317 domain-containing protein [Tissierellia bacterium]MDD4781567.1 DUF5317 domain-containing protein [Tissierellia bacterium]